MQVHSPSGDKEQRLGRKRDEEEKKEKKRGAGLKSRQQESEWEMITKRDAV